MKTIFTLITAFLIAITGMAQNVGQTAPDFTLNDLNNQNYTLSGNKGKVVFIFFVGNTCPNCIASAPTVKSTIIDAFKNNNKFQTLVIDTWDGSASAVQNFKNTTGLDATYLQKGSTVASKWSITYDRLAVVDAEGKLVFKGTRAASSDATLAKSAIQTALNNQSTAVNTVEIKNDFRLGQNYPNPFVTETKISFHLPGPAEVALTVYDLTGKKVFVPAPKFYTAGQHEIFLFRNQFQSGIYFYRLDAGHFSSTKKMIVQ